MKRILHTYFIFALLALLACQTETNKPNTKKQVQEIKTEGEIRNSDIIRNPVSADQPLDTVNVAKMTFKETSYDFGTVMEGAAVKHTFVFENTGKAPLLISDARSTCGCTVPNWPKNPILPGEKGNIKVVFKTEGKPNKQQKPINITANTYPSTTVLQLKGTVTPKK